MYLIKLEMVFLLFLFFYFSHIYIFNFPLNFKVMFWKIMRNLMN